MEDFTTLAYLLSFPGMIAAVIMLTQFTKNMVDKTFAIPTKYVAYFWAMGLCVVATIFQGSFGTGQEILETVLVWSINSVIVWFAAMKTFELVSSKPGEIITVDILNKDNGVYMEALEHAAKLLDHSKEVRLRNVSDKIKR